jgi:molybdopterin-biosynthesis enzyme MoeA-like protein
MEFYDKPKKIIHYPNAIKRKYQNKSVTIQNFKEGYVVEILNHMPEEANMPACAHNVHRDKVRVTQLFLTKETLLAIAANALDMLSREAD